MQTNVVLVLVHGVCVLAATAGAEDWPQFRGPGGRGIAEGARFPDRWSASKNIAWKCEIPGRGWSSPIVSGRRVFLTTAVNLGQSEAPKKGLYLFGNRPEPPRSEHEWRVLCLDLESGRVIWERTVHRGLPRSAIHLKNSYASETPVTDGQRVYAYFGNVGLYALDMDGSLVWSRAFEPRRTRDGWGTAASPALLGDRIFLVQDNEEQSRLLALHTRTGEIVWQVERDEKSNWSTPCLWVHGERTEIVTAGSGKVRSYDLDGKLLWWLRGMSGITIPTPHASDQLLYVSSGFVMSLLRPLYAIRPGASGDISLQGNRTTSQHIAWCVWRAGPYNPSTLLYQGRLYVLLDRGMLSCYDAERGTPLYERERIPQGKAFTASPWACGGKIFCLNEDGVTFVFRAGDSCQLLHTNPLAEDDMCLTTPAASGDRLLIRSSQRLYCIRQPAAE